MDIAHIGSEKIPDESLVRCPHYYVLPKIRWDHPVEGTRNLSVWDLVHALNANHQIGNILKYAIRAGKKPGVPYEKDIRKLYWCAVSELRRLGIPIPESE